MAELKFDIDLAMLLKKRLAQPPGEFLQEYGTTTTGENINDPSALITAEETTRLLQLYCDQQIKAIQLLGSLIRQMRSAQRKYFRERAKNPLASLTNLMIESKEHEKMVDLVVVDIPEPDGKARPGELF